MVVGPFSAIALDVDGTLVDAAGVMPASAASAVRDLTGRGVAVVLATARGPAGLRSVLDELKRPLWIVAYQGALVARLPSAGGLKVPAETTLQLDTAQDVVRLCRRLGVTVGWYDRDGWWAEALTEAAAEEARATGDPPRLVQDLLAVVTPPHKLLVMAPFADAGLLDEVAARVPEPARAVRSQVRYLEVVPPGVDKATGLRVVAEDLRIPGEAFVAVGDGENDIDMFRVAGYSAAMATAPISVQRAADAVIGAANADGLAAFIGSLAWTPAEDASQSGGGGSS